MQNLNNFILNVLGQSNYVILNKTLMKSIGCHETILLSYMIDKWRYFNGEDFYYLIEDIMEDIPMFKERKLRETISNLIEIGILVKKAFKGAPPRQFYNIDAEKLFNIIASDANLKGFKKDSFNHCKNNNFNPCKNASFQYNINRDNNNRDNSIEFDKKDSKEPFLSHSLVQNEILHDCERETKTDLNLSPKPSENKATSKKGRQGDMTLFESLPKSKGYTEEFETFWILYRKHNAKDKAFAYKSYCGALKNGATHTQLLEAVKKQIEIWEIKKPDPNFIPMCSTWLNKKRYKDDFEAIKQQTLTKTTASAPKDYNSYEGGIESFKNLRDNDREADIVSIPKDIIKDMLRFIVHWSEIVKNGGYTNAEVEQLDRDGVKYIKDTYWSEVSLEDHLLSYGYGTNIYQLLKNKGYF